MDNFNKDLAIGYVYVQLRVSMEMHEEFPRVERSPWEVSVMLVYRWHLISWKLAVYINSIEL